MDTVKIGNRKDQMMENPEENLEQNQSPFQDMNETTPIKVLTNNVLDWVIKARITKKYERKTWSNARGQGYLLNIDLID